MRSIAVDIGNDTVKVVTGLQSQDRFAIPNVMAPAPMSREVLEFEKTLEEGLHVEIVSPAMPRGVFYVGKLATKTSHNDELTVDSEKSENTQSMVMLLTALALDAVRQFEETEGVVEAHYALSTGLPLDEAKQGKRKAFKKKLKAGVHEVRFRDTPEYGGKLVRIHLDEVLVNVEGHAAMLDLTTENDGTPKNQELCKMTVLLNDIGGLSTDAAIIHPNGEIDNFNSDGIRQGVAPYLDAIIFQVERKYKYPFKSRRELVTTMTHPDPKERNVIWVKGKPQSIQAEVDEALLQLAREEYKHLQEVWNRVPSIRTAVLIGGGSVILRPYLEQINLQADQLPLRFLGVHESIWMISNAYFKLLALYLAQKGL